MLMLSKLVDAVRDGRNQLWETIDSATDSIVCESVRRQLSSTSSESSAVLRRPKLVCGMPDNDFDFSGRLLGDINALWVDGDGILLEA